LLAFSPDGRQFVWFQDGPHVYLADLASGETLRTLPPQLGGRRMAFSRDGRTLALDGAGPTLWEVATGKVRHQFTGNNTVAHAVAFSHDYSLLASGHADTTVLIWDIWGALAVKPSAPLSEADLEKAWSALGEADERKAFAAMRSLYQHPGGGVPLLKTRLDHLARHAGTYEISRLIRDLESGQFRVRGTAAERLHQLGATARPALLKAAKELTTLEGRRRAERVLQDLTSSPTGSWLQTLRAVEVLEALPGEAATQALQALARHEAHHPLTIEAKTSLARRASSPSR
jgi:hypothetical protein